MRQWLIKKRSGLFSVDRIILRDDGKWTHEIPIGRISHSGEAGDCVTISLIKKFLEDKEMPKNFIIEEIDSEVTLEMLQIAMGLED